MSKNLKLSIYIQSKGTVDYKIVSEFPTEFHDDCWNVVYPAKSIHNIRVNVSSLSDQGYLQISKVCLNSVQLHNFNLWSCYTTQQGICPAEHTYGYMHQPGEYILKIRQNPLVHNYINYFLSLCTN